MRAASLLRALLVGLAVTLPGEPGRTFAALATSSPAFIQISCHKKCWNGAVSVLRSSGQRQRHEGLQQGGRAYRCGSRLRTRVCLARQTPDSSTAGTPNLPEPARPKIAPAGIRRRGHDSGHFRGRSTGLDAPQSIQDLELLSTSACSSLGERIVAVQDVRELLELFDRHLPVDNANNHSVVQAFAKDAPETTRKQKHSVTPVTWREAALAMHRLQMLKAPPPSTTGASFHSIRDTGHTATPTVSAARLQSAMQKWASFIIHAHGIHPPLSTHSALVPREM